MSHRYDLDALRAAVPVPAVLAAAGIAVPVRQRRMACPLHGAGDGNPQAFSWTANGQHWQCWSCGAKGDVFTLDQRLRNVSFRAAVKHLAALAGLDRAPRLSQRVLAARQAEQAKARAARAQRARLLLLAADTVREIEREARRMPDTPEGWARLEALYVRRDRVEAWEAGQ